MTANRTILTVLLSTLVFTLVFYNKSLGINLLLFESAVLLWLLWTKKVQLTKFNVLFVFLAVLLSVLFSLIHHTNLSIKVNVLCFFLFVGVISEPRLKSLWNSFLTAFSSFFNVFYHLNKRLSGPRINQKKIGFKVRRNLLLILPLVIILGFTIIYSSANPKFGELVTSFFELVLDGFTTFFTSVNLALIGVVLLGMMISLFVFVRTRNERIANGDADSGDQLYRTRRKILTPFSPIGLTNEYRSAVFLFLSLNCLLLVINVLDVNYVWFNFIWEGQYLKDFVHNGVYVLLFAILVSILLVLFVFRANLNFYRKGIWLKRLTYFWLTQNLILAVSVGIRNWYYIDYYALADRRIAIFFFLLLVVVALFTVFVKVHKTR